MNPPFIQSFDEVALLAALGTFLEPAIGLVTITSGVFFCISLQSFWSSAQVDLMTNLESLLINVV